MRSGSILSPLEFASDEYYKHIYVTLFSNSTLTR